MDNEWRQPPIRLSGAQPQNGQFRQQWTRDDRFLTFMSGALASLVVVCCVALSDGTEKSPFVWLAVVLFGATILGASYIIRQFKPDFKERGAWAWAGVIIGGVVFAPLILTPPCDTGWALRCKPVVHHQTPQRHVPR